MIAEDAAPRRYGHLALPALALIVLVISGIGPADPFLGTQGDIRGTQRDMFLAPTGAVLSLAILSRLHDPQMARYIGQRGTHEPC